MCQTPRENSLRAQNSEENKAALGSENFVRREIINPFCKSIVVPDRLGWERWRWWIAQVKALYRLTYFSVRPGCCLTLCWLQHRALRFNNTGMSVRTRSSKLTGFYSLRYSLNLSGTSLPCKPAVPRSGCKARLQSSLFPVSCIATLPSAAPTKQRAKPAQKDLRAEFKQSR